MILFALPFPANIIYVYKEQYLNIIPIIFLCKKLFRYH